MAEHSVAYDVLGFVPYAFKVFSLVAHVITPSQQ
jgi:hypothetical protein